MHRSHRVWPWLAVVLALAAGCRGEASTDRGGGGRVIRMAVPENPPQLDSTKATDVTSSFVLGHIQEGLTNYGPSGEIVPGVAESWDIRDMGATFHLRKEARWSDGKPVTARDFVFAWRNVVDPANASEYAFIVYTVKNGEAINGGKMPITALGVHAVDDHTLEVEFERPCPYFLGLTAFKTFDPIREDFYRAHPGRYGATAQELLSNGPFTLTHWDQEASLTLEKNPLYWNAQSIRLDRIEIPYITRDPNARLNLFRDGSVDFLEAIGRDESKRAQVEQLPMKSFDDGGIWYLAFNHRPKRPTANIHLRRAIQLVFDPREYISAVIGIPGTRQLVGIVPSWMLGVKQTFRREHPLPPLRPDLEAAKRELELAKKDLGGKIPQLTWLTFEGGGAQREAEYFQYVLKSRLGLDVVIDKQIFRQVLAKMLAGEFDIVVAGWQPDYADPMTFADLWASWNENNRGRYSNPRYDALIRKAQAETDPVARMDLMAAAERIAVDDLAILPTYERVQVYVQSRRVEGIVRRQIGPDPDLTHATIVDEEPSRAWSATR